MDKKKLAIAALLCLGCGAVPVNAASEDGSLSLRVANVSIEGLKKWKKEQILNLVPALKEDTVDAKLLSRQIRLVNDAGAVEIFADFQETSVGTYHVVLHVAEKKAAQATLEVNNTGNRYTGEARLSLTGVHKNLTGHSDALSVAYVTSPGHWNDVKQAAVGYRMLLPDAADSMAFYYTYSDVNLGQIANFGGMGIEATGRGSTYGVHYQKNFVNSTARRQMVDVGFDRKNYKNAQNYSYFSTPFFSNGTDFDVTTLSLTYMDAVHSKNNAFSYSVGIVGNMDNQGEKYRAYRANSDPHYLLWTAGLNYQHRTDSDWLFGIRAHGQYTQSSVVTTEQLGAGGMYSVRGFKERVLSGDKGVVGSLEIYTPAIAKHHRFVLFSDFAQLSNTNPGYGELRNESIASVGVGYRLFDLNGLSITLDYAAAVKEPSHSADYKRPWHIRVQQTF